jgi:hypothetical protein
MCYESNFDVTAFKLPFGLEDIYKLVNKCFAEPTDTIYEPGYSVLMELDNSMLRLEFQCVVGGFLNLSFELFLREKLMSNDAQLTINFQRMEQKQQQAFEQLTKRMEEMERRLEALGYANICFKSRTNSLSLVKSYPINLTSLVINDNQETLDKESFEKIKFFYQLEELTLNYCESYEPEKNVSNKTVKILTISCSTKFRDISFIKNYPSLECLNIQNGTLDASTVTTLRSMKHNIKSFTFTGCSGINQPEMQTYCIQNRIKLNLS